VSANFHVHISNGWVYGLWTLLMICFLFVGFVRNIFLEAFAMEQKAEVEGVFNKASHEWKNW